MRIVYVEDNLTNIALVERICTLSRDQLVTYVDAQTALAEIEPGMTDLILMDLHLGNHSMNGLELTRRLRQKGVDVPVIGITAYDTLFAGQYQEAGLDIYVNKPVAVQDMLDLIDTYRM
jgi:two-component system capsular synthesis sensor histidine kinase RcsC